MTLIVQFRTISPKQPYGDQSRPEQHVRGTFCLNCALSANIEPEDHMFICCIQQQKMFGVNRMSHWAFVRLILQTDGNAGRNPSIKKSLFPLFNSKNSLKHNSAVKVLPVVPQPMVLLA